MQQVIPEAAAAKPNSRSVSSVSSCSKSKPADLDGAMARELLRGERWRAGLVALAALALSLLAVVLRLSDRDASASVAVRFRLGVSALGTLLAYEIGVLLSLSYWMKLGRPSPTLFRYLNTAVEVSLPTVAIFLLGREVGMVQALNGAAPYVYFILVVLSTLYLDFRLCVVAGMVAAAGYGLLAFVAVGRHAPLPGWELVTSPLAYRMKAAILLLTGFAAGFVAAQIRRQVLASVRRLAERDRAISIFGQHVSPQVAEMLLHQPLELAGEERNVCVMFLDIRDFSSLAGERTPGEVMEYLNTLFAPMIGLVNQHHGIVNKFLGDGFMAVFGAPVDDGEQCRHAVEAARSLLGTVSRLNQEGRIPATRIGIGLHMGRAVTGNVGSAERKEYTIIGDVVNLASRIEQATKQFNARLLISDAVRAMLDPARYPSEDLGLVELKGQSKPARLHRLA